MTIEDLTKTSGVTIDENTKYDTPNDDNYIVINKLNINNIMETLSQNDNEKITNNMSDLMKNMNDTNPEIFKVVADYLSTKTTDSIGIDNITSNDIQNITKNLMESIDNDTLIKCANMINNMIENIDNDILLKITNMVPNFSNVAK